MSDVGRAALPFAGASGVGAAGVPAFAFAAAAAGADAGAGAAAGCEAEATSAALTFARGTKGDASIAFGGRVLGVGADGAGADAEAVLASSPLEERAAVAVVAFFNSLRPLIINVGSETAKELHEAI